MSHVSSSYVLACCTTQSRHAVSTHSRSLVIQCRPVQYPDLQQLRETSYWDSVIIASIPEVPVAAASLSSTISHANGLAVSPTSSQESLSDAQAESCTSTPEVDQAVAPHNEAQSMLILGLRGQNHDLER